MLTAPPPTDRAHRKLTLITAQFVALNMAAERGTLDETEATGAARLALPTVNTDYATTHAQAQAHRSKLTLIKAKFFALNTAALRGTSNETEATRHRAHNQRRRLKADDCDRTTCTSVIIHFRWEEMPTPTTLPRSPHAIHLPSYWESLSEPHTCDFNAAFSLLMLYISSHVLSKIAINISIFHLGSYIRGARTPGSAPWPADDIVWQHCGQVRAASCDGLHSKLRRRERLG